MTDKILVTGATGKVGKELVSRLLEKGAAVKAADINLEHTKSVAVAEGWQDIELVLFDYDKPETFEPALAGVDRVFVVPPLLSPRQHEQIMPFIDMAAKTGVRHIVNLSQMGSDEIEGLPLGIAEKYIGNCGITCTQLRPNWFMQNCNTFMLDGIRTHGKIFEPVGEAKASFIDLRDIAAVAVEALTTDKHMNKTYILTGGKALDYYEVAKVLSTVTGQQIEYTPMSEDDMRAAMKAAGWADGSIQMTMNLYELLKQGGTEPVTTNVANVLGREPITFEQYAQDYAECWK